MPSRMMEEARKVRRRLSMGSTQHTAPVEDTRGREATFSNKRRGRRSRSFDASAILGRTTKTSTGDDVEDTDHNNNPQETKEDSHLLKNEQQEVESNDNESNKLSNLISSLSDETRKQVRRFSMESSPSNFPPYTSSASAEQDDNGKIKEPSPKQKSRGRLFRKTRPLRSRSFDVSLSARPINNNSKTSELDDVSDDGSVRRPTSFKQSHSEETSTFTLRDAKEKAMRVFEDAKRRVVSSKSNNSMPFHRAISDGSLDLDDTTTNSLDAVSQEEQIFAMDDGGEAKRGLQKGTSLKVKEVQLGSGSGDMMPFLQLDTSIVPLNQGLGQRQRRRNSMESTSSSRAKKKSWRELLAKSPSVRADPSWSQANNAKSKVPSTEPIDEEPTPQEPKATGSSDDAANSTRTPIRTRSSNLRSEQRKYLAASASPKKPSSRSRKVKDPSPLRGSDRVMQDKTRATNTRARVRDNPRTQQVTRRKRSQSGERSRLLNQATGEQNGGGKPTADQDPISRRGRKSKSSERSSTVLESNIVLSPTRAGQRNTRVARRTHTFRRPRSKDRTADVGLTASEQTKLARSPHTTRRRITERKPTDSFDKSPGTSSPRLSMSERSKRMIDGHFPDLHGTTPQSDELNIPRNLPLSGDGAEVESNSPRVQHNQRTIGDEATPEPVPAQSPTAPIGHSRRRRNRRRSGSADRGRNARYAEALGQPRKTGREKTSDTKEGQPLESVARASETSPGPKNRKLSRSDHLARKADREPVAFPSATTHTKQPYRRRSMSHSEHAAGIAFNASDRHNRAEARSNDDNTKAHPDHAQNKNTTVSHSRNRVGPDRSRSTEARRISNSVQGTGQRRRNSRERLQNASEQAERKLAASNSFPHDVADPIQMSFEHDGDRSAPSSRRSAVESTFQSNGGDRINRDSEEMGSDNDDRRPASEKDVHSGGENYHRTAQRRSRSAERILLRSNSRERMHLIYGGHNEMPNGD
eukprot:scaffold5970_cov130-Cylindrotheca_fusiformis.AAC.3